MAILKVIDLVVHLHNIIKCNDINQIDIFPLKYAAIICRNFQYCHKLLTLTQVSNTRGMFQVSLDRSEWAYPCILCITFIYVDTINMLNGVCIEVRLPISFKPGDSCPQLAEGWLLACTWFTEIVSSFFGDSITLYY